MELVAFVMTMLSMCLGTLDQLGIVAQQITWGDQCLASNVRDLFVCYVKMDVKDFCV